MAKLTVLEKDTQAYKNMEAVAALLTATSVKNIKYNVEETYFDLGLNWKWTTIIYRDSFCGVQLLNPNEYTAIVNATTMDELVAVVEEIKNDKYFTDK